MIEKLDVIEKIRNIEGVALLSERDVEEIAKLIENAISEKQQNNVSKDNIQIINIM